MTNPVSSSMIQQVTQLLQAQRKMLAAQIKAMATNSVPPLKMFSGDDFYTEEGSFDHWLELFEDRAKSRQLERQSEIVSTEVQFGEDCCSCCTNDAK